MSVTKIVMRAFYSGKCADKLNFVFLSELTIFYFFQFQEIDEYINQAKEKGYSAVLQLGSKGVNYATTVIMQTAIKVFRLVTMQSQTTAKNR